MTRIYVLQCQPWRPVTQTQIPVPAAPDQIQGLRPGCHPLLWLRAPLERACGFATNPGKPAVACCATASPPTKARWTTVEKMYFLKWTAECHGAAMRKFVPRTVSTCECQVGSSALYASMSTERSAPKLPLNNFFMSPQ